ncbi:MAG: pyridoxamine 5'-phosphate oxidase family protein [Gammaproteobacteria bacterium]|nr:pyridoxamine 5'-phosphate oxidase family protein [Gammaproteobacteria bacterium]MBV9698191.1 pyridoxamine 5'-phosphate oxidase family protein [Gammaproteobacteria bacterium]
MGSRGLEAERLESILAGFDTTMMVTNGTAGLHARPMHLIKRPSASLLYLVSGADSGKVAELEADAEVLLACQDARQFLVLRGRASLTRDRGLIEQLWSDAWRVWFPQGKYDPNICLIQVEPREGEYWDNSGARGLKYAFQAAQAYASGKPPHPDSTQHGKVRM